MEFCHLHDVVTIYGCIVSNYISGNDPYSSRLRNTPFHSMYLPPLSIKDYMERIYRYFNCSAECYILSLIYIDRLIHSDSFIMNGFSAYRVVLTSLMLSAKFFDDVYFTNAYYAEIGGIPVTELNSLEVDFLCRIHFSLSVSPQEYQRYYNDLSGHCRSCLNCYAIQLPVMVNCCPFDETPLLRFVRRQLTPFPSTFTSTQSYPSSYTPFDSGYMTRQSGCANNSLVWWNTGYY